MSRYFTFHDRSPQPDESRKYALAESALQQLAFVVRPVGNELLRGGINASTAIPK
jgi:hypothetical protein